MSKVWKKVPGYSRYEASSDGEIKFLDTDHVTKGGISGSYRRVAVYADGSKERVLAYVHDLVCRAFHGVPKKNEVVLHKDDDKHNCRPSNLKYGTQSQNIKSAYDNGLISKESALPSGFYW